MLDEFSTTRKFGAKVISIACYVSNLVFLDKNLVKLFMSYGLRICLLSLTFVCFGANALC
jgi:hypothetical protein